MALVSYAVVTGLGFGCTSAETATGGNGGNGGNGGANNGGAGGNGNVGGGTDHWMPVVEAANIVSTVDDAIDAAPDPDGTMIYFIGQTRAGVGVFRVSVEGGAPDPLVVGDPFVDPRGIVVSHDEQTVYVADTQAGSGGALVALNLTDMTAAVLPVTEGLSPTAVEIRELGEQDQIVFAGKTARGTPAVFTLAEGGTQVSVEQTQGLVDPDGIAVGRDGSLYVTDRGAGAGDGVVLHYEGGPMPILVDANLTLGTPAGIAVLTDDQAALTSALDPATGTSQVAITFLNTGVHAVFDETIGANHASGGLHRSYRHNVYAWAGRTAGVYRVKVSPPVESSTFGGVGG